MLTLRKIQSGRGEAAKEGETMKKSKIGSSILGKLREIKNLVICEIC